jgi:hypothetical protein
MCHHLKPKSVSSYLSGICNQLQAIYPDIRINRKRKLVTNTLRGCTKLRAVPTSRKCAITRAELATACRQRLSWGLRLGELTWPDKRSLQDYRKITLRHSVIVNDNNYSFFLPFHKADHLFEGNHILIQTTNTDDDPLSTFRDYLRSRDVTFPLNPELWLRANGSIPTRRWSIRRLTPLFPNNIGGQSLRAGGATAMLKQVYQATLSRHLVIGPPKRSKYTSATTLPSLPQSYETVDPRDFRGPPSTPSQSKEKRHQKTTNIAS